MTITFDKDIAYIAVTENGVVFRRSIRLEDTVVSLVDPDGSSSKVDLIYVNSAGKLILVLEDESEVEVAGTLTGSVLTLEATPLTDGEYSGLVEVGVAGTTLAFGDCVYQAAADAKWELAKADAASASDGKIGICVVAAAEDAATTILLFGKVRADAVFPTFSVRRPVYISAATAGDLTATAPSGTTNFVVRIVGYGNTADELYFCPNNAYVELV